MDKEEKKKSEINSFNDLPTEIQDILLQSRKSVKQGKVFSHDYVMTESRKKWNIK